MNPNDESDMNPKLQHAMQLIGALCDERITPEQFSELESLVCTDQEIRSLYVEMMHLHAGLHYFASALLDMEPPLRLDEEPAGEQSFGMNETMVMPAMKDSLMADEQIELTMPGPVTLRPAKQRAHYHRHLIKAGIAALVTIGLALLAYSLPFVNSPSVEAFKLPITKPAWDVAYLDVSAKPVWESQPPGDGTFIAGQSLVITSGAVQLRLRHGGRLVIEGPAEIRFISDIEFRVNSGRVAATFPGGGLIVRCPTGSIRDLGTQFGVSVDAGTGNTEVEVFEGHVSAALSKGSTTQPAEPLVMKAGQAAILSDSTVTKSPQGAIPQRYICNLRNIQIDSLDVVDLISGGDGKTRRRGFAVDAANGDIGVLTPVQLRTGDGKYHAVHGIPVVDGAFIPDGTHGAMTVDSAGHQFAFPPTSNSVTNQIWTGGQIPWPDELGISTSFGGIDYSTPDHSLISTHCNNAITLDLNAVRRLYPDRALTRFHCRFGNSYVNGLKGAVKVNPISSAYVLMNGATRYQKVQFSNQDGLMAIDLPISKEDRFMTLAAIDDGKEIDRDWILWTDATFDISPAN